MLVVLAMVGLVSTLALPQLSIMRDRLEFNLSRETFEQELGGLSYRAMSEGKPFVLVGQYPRSDKDPSSAGQSPSDFPENPLAAMVDEPMERGQYRAQLPVNADTAPLSLPPRWKLTAAKPVIYQVSGFCSGGSVTLVVGQQRYTYDLKAPECRVGPAK